jgi:hypothetical protein
MAAALATIGSLAAAPIAALGQSEAPATDLAQYIGSPDKALCGDKQWTIGYDAFSDTESCAGARNHGREKLAGDHGGV